MFFEHSKLFILKCFFSTLIFNIEQTIRNQFESIKWHWTEIVSQCDLRPNQFFLKICDLHPCRHEGHHVLKAPSQFVLAHAMAKINWSGGTYWIFKNCSLYQAFLYFSLSSISFTVKYHTDECKPLKFQE